MSWRLTVFSPVDSSSIVSCYLLSLLSCQKFTSLDSTHSRPARTASWEEILVTGDSSRCVLLGRGHVLLGRPRSLPKLSLFKSSNPGRKTLSCRSWGLLNSVMFYNIHPLPDLNMGWDVIPGWWHGVGGPLPQSYFASRWVHSWGLRAAAPDLVPSGDWVPVELNDKAGLLGVCPTSISVRWSSAPHLMWWGGWWTGLWQVFLELCMWSVPPVGGQPAGDHSFIPQILLIIHVSSLMMIRRVYVSLATTSTLRLSVNLSNNSHW